MSGLSIKDIDFQQILDKLFPNQNGRTYYHWVEEEHFQRVVGELFEGRLTREQTHEIGNIIADLTGKERMYRSCNLGVGCDESGVCYAEANNCLSMCGKRV